MSFEHMPQQWQPVSKGWETVSENLSKFWFSNLAIYQVDW
jgi:hypothetical protein